MNQLHLLLVIYMIKIDQNHSKRQIIYLILFKRNILIFDLGVDNLDISIIKVKNKTIEVLSNYVDNHLGGKYFTNILTDYIINSFKEDEGYEDIDFKDKNNKKTYTAFQKLKSKVEEYKKQLSFENEVEILPNEPFYEGKEINIVITRQIYENV